jgi:hypothetical protein
MMLLRPLLLALGTEGLLLRGCCAEFVLLEPDNYEKHFAEGFPGPWANGSGVGEINETTFEWAQENVLPSSTRRMQISPRHIISDGRRTTPT